MTNAAEINQIVADAEYDHYAIRINHGYVAKVGTVPAKSYRWDDGETTDERLNGTCGFEITGEITDELISDLLSTYCFDDAHVTLIAGYSREFGEDDGEIIISDPVYLA